MNRYKPVGWRNENYRHSLAARGLSKKISVGSTFWPTKRNSFYIPGRLMKRKPLVVVDGFKEELDISPYMSDRDRYAVLQINRGDVDEELSREISSERVGRPYLKPYIVKPRPRSSKSRIEILGEYTDKSFRETRGQYVDGSDVINLGSDPGDRFKYDIEDLSISKLRNMLNDSGYTDSQREMIKRELISRGGNVLDLRRSPLRSLKMALQDGTLVKRDRDRILKEIEYRTNQENFEWED